MNTDTIDLKNIEQTKKADLVGSLSLVEAASLQVVLFGFMSGFPAKPRILRGNTEAPEKLLLHASTYIVSELRALVKDNNMELNKYSL